MILHGGPGLDQNYLQPQLFELTKNNKLIFYDQRGSGKSLHFTNIPESLNIAQFVLDIEKLRSELKLNKFILMGHSWGSFLGMHYATQYPEHLSGLILLNTYPPTSKGQQSFIYNFMNKTAAITNDILPLFSYEEFQKLNSTEMETVYRKLFSIYFHNSSYVKDLSLVINTDSYKSGFKVYEEMSKNSQNFDEQGLLSKLIDFKKPTLLIHGGNDIIPLWVAKEINSVIKSSDLVILDSCGHFPYIETPKEFMHAINSFITHIEASS